MSEESSFAEKAHLWIDVLKLLEEDPAAQVLCPECTEGRVRVIDAPMSNDRRERWFQCTACGKGGTARQDKKVERQDS